MGYFSDNEGRGGFLSNIPEVTRNIILINVFVFLFTSLRPEYMYEHFSLFYPASPYFKPWQVITHMFMHGGFWHLFFNMYTLLIFGSVLERMWGPRKFLLFYFVTGLGAAALHTGVEAIQAVSIANDLGLTPELKGFISGKMAETGTVPAIYVSYGNLLSTPTVGASGAIYGLLLGYAMLFPDSVLTLLFPPVSLKAKWFVIIFAAIELLTGLTGVGGGIAHFAHLGGMLFGWLMIWWWKKQHTLYDYR